MTERDSPDSAAPWDVRYLLGSINSRLKNLEDRAAEDRETIEEHHVQNQNAIGEIKTDLRLLMTANGASPLSGRQRAAVGSILFALVAVVVWLLDKLLGSAFAWLISHIKFGG